LVEQVLQGVRGLRQSLSYMHRTRAQALFAGAIGLSLKEVAKAIDECLEASSKRTAFLSPSALSYDQEEAASSTARSTVTSTVISTVTSTATSTAISTVVSMVTSTGTEAKLRHHPPRSRQPSLPQAAERLEGALAKMMSDYNRARREILYGLDESGRPLEDSDEEMPRHERSPSYARGPVPFDKLQMRAERNSSISRPSHPSTVVVVDGPSSSSAEAAVKSEAEEEEEEGETGEEEREEGGGRTEVPNHLLIMKERQKLGSSATMARGAFLFSLAKLCKNLTEDRIVLTRGWRMSHSAEAARFALKGAWEAIRPPPGLLHTVRSAVQHAKSCCLRCPRNSSR
ncbi:unnamed protein product, partial [Laminaria digitata]